MDLTDARAAEMNALRVADPTNSLPPETKFQLLRYNKDGDGAKAALGSPVDDNYFLTAAFSEGARITNGFRLQVADVDDDATLQANLAAATDLTFSHDKLVYHVVSRDAPQGETRVWWLFIERTGERWDWS